LKAPKTFYVVR